VAPLPPMPVFSLLEMSELRQLLRRQPRASRPAETALGKIEAWLRKATEPEDLQ